MTPGGSRGAGRGQVRWPGRLYDAGTEPDPRFTLANERTFLAGMRTALALLAAGVALDVVPLDASRGAQRALAALLVATGILCGANTWWRWLRAELALRRAEPLPGWRFGALLTVLVGVVGLGLLVTLLWP